MVQIYYLLVVLAMQNFSISRFRAIMSSFYANLVHSPVPKNAVAGRMPMTVIGDFRDRTLVNKMPPQEAGVVDIDQFFSVDEQQFIQNLKAEFQLSEDDLLIFNLVAYARHAGQEAVMSSAKPNPGGAMRPDFSPQFLSMLMESIKPNLVFSRGYYAAMVYLKNHPVPAAWA